MVVRQVVQVDQQEVDQQHRPQELAALEQLEDAASQELQARLKSLLKRRPLTQSPLAPTQAERLQEQQEVSLQELESSPHFAAVVCASARP